MGTMTVPFIIVQIILSIALTVALLLQAKGGGLGGILGQSNTVYRTRRGVEKILFQITIVLIVFFIGTSLLMLKVVG